MNKKQTSQITVRVPRALKEDLQKIADSQMRTLENQAAFFMAEGLHAWGKSQERSLEEPCKA